MPRDGCKYYRFDLNTNKTYQFSLCSAVGGSSSFNSKVQVLDGACNVLKEDTNFCGNDGQVNWRTTSPGSVYVRVVNQSSANGGPYTLEYKDLDCKSCAAGTFDRSFAVVPVAFTSAGADATQAGCWRVYRFLTIPTITYRFSLCAADLPAAGAVFNSTIDVYGNGCGLLGSNSSACSDDGKVVVVANSVITYVVVRGDNPDVDFGTFTLAYKRN